MREITEGTEVYVTGSTGLRVSGLTTVTSISEHLGDKWVTLASGSQRPMDQVHRADDTAYWSKLGYQMETCPCEPVGEKQIADRLGLQRKSLNMARLRAATGQGTMPPPQWTVGRDPAWCWPHQILPWRQPWKGR